MNKPTPTAPVPFIHRISTFINEQGRQMVMREAVDKFGNAQLDTLPTYEAHDVMQMRVQMPDGSIQTVDQAFAFTVPDSINLADAYARWDAHRRAGAEAFIQLQRMAALRAGATLDRLPQGSV